MKLFDGFFGVCSWIVEMLDRPAETHGVPAEVGQAERAPEPTGAQWAFMFGGAVAVASTFWFVLPLLLR